MKATRQEKPFSKITVLVTIENEEEMELLDYITQNISRGCIDEKSHTFEQRDALLNLAEIVCIAAFGDNKER